MLFRFKKVLAFIAVASICAGLLAGCGKVNGKQTALTVNGENVSLGTVSTLTRYQEAESKYVMSMYGYATEGSPYWDTDYSSEDFNGTYGDYFMNGIKDDIVNMVLVRQHAPEYGYTISEDDKKEISEAAAQFISDNGSVAEWIGADQESVENLLSLYNYQAKTRNLFVADVDKEVSDEEAGQSTVLYAYISSTKPSDFEGTEEEYAAQAEEQMKQMLETSKTADLEAIEAEEHASEGTDAAQEETADTEEEKTITEKVSDEVHAYSHVAEDISSNITVSSTSYTTSSPETTTLPEEVSAAAKNLSDGEFSNDVIKTDKGWYIVKMEAAHNDDATESKKNSIISERETARYDELLQTWKDASDITYNKCLDQIKVTDKESYVVAQN